MSERYKPQDPPAHLVAECIALDPEAAPAGLRWRERPRWHFATAAAWAQWNGRFGGQPIAGSINNRGEFRLGLRTLRSTVFAPDPSRRRRPAHRDLAKGDATSAEVTAMSDAYGREPLRFATAKLLMRMTRGHCPCHDDKTPSFSAKPGREPGTTVVACGVCSRSKEGHLALLAHFRKLGYRLGPMQMAPPKRPPRPVDLATSVAFRILTRAEQTMYGLIATGKDPSYDEFEAADVHRQAIPGGLRAMQALGLIGVIRSNSKEGLSAVSAERKLDGCPVAALGAAGGD